MHFLTRLCTAGGAALLATTFAGAGTVLYVDDDAALGGDGLGWGTAYRYLQDALADAAADATINEIRVGQGTYTPDIDEAGNVLLGDREATFQLLDGVSLKGGYAGQGAPDPDARIINVYTTILSGDLLGDDLPGFVNDGENSYSVVTGTATSPTAVIDGFTIRAGHANGPDPGNLEWIRGGGMWTFAGSPTVLDCTFTANRAQGYGGGMYNHTGSNTTVTSCVFIGNVAVDFNGGGMHNFSGSSPTITLCVFTANTATGVGGAIRNSANALSVITDCIFTGNSAFSGGAIFNNDGSDVQVSGCTFNGNVADPVNGAGGGVRNVLCSPTFDDCLFTLNTAWVGGGMYNSDGHPVLTSCTFDQNNALAGGALYNFTASAIVTDCDFTSNSSNGNGVGGAVVNTIETNATYTNCTFVDNAGGGSGGAMGNFLESSPTITDCTFTNNSTNIGGGGMINQDNCHPIVSNCTFTGNAAGPNGTGGGMRNAVNSNPTITNCTFTANTSINNGGGMFNFQSSPTIVWCEFTDNAGFTGGGIRNFDNCNPFIAKCTFTGNTAQQHGGGIGNAEVSSPIIFSCLFTDNFAAVRGGAMKDGLDCNVCLVNCTLSGNSAGQAGGGVSTGSPVAGSTGNTWIKNCILWDNTAPAGFGPQIALLGNFPSELTVDFTDVEGGEADVFIQFGSTLNWGPGNIDVDPMFTGGFHMATGSPCIDAGHNWSVPLDAADLDSDGNLTELSGLDLDRSPRFADDPATADTGCGTPVIVDMGAIEYQGDPFDVILADLDGDGIVGVLDFLQLLSDWGPCEDPCCLSDLNRDGFVDTIDFLLLLSRWTI